MCERAKPTRRDFVCTAAGGLVLAASGLLLPAGVETSTAHEGAAGGQLGGRRGKNQRGRDKQKRRDHGEKKDKANQGPPPGRGLFEFRRTALTVKSFTDPPVTLTFYYRVKTGLDSYGPWIADRSETPAFGASTRFANDRFRIGVLVSAPEQAGTGQMFLDVRNVTYDYPKGSATYRFEGGIDPVRNNLGQTLMGEKQFSEVSFPSYGFYAVSETLVFNTDVRRLADSDDFIEFQLIVSNRTES